MIKFIHTADIHLDSPLRGLENYPGAPAEALRLATRQAFDQVIDLCLEEQVDFLVIAGDLFDTDVKDFNTALEAAAQLRRLHQANIPVYLISGNHDSRQEMTRHVPWPDNVTLFDHKKPQTVRHPTLPITLHGMSYPQREVTDNLVPLYPPPEPDRFNIGLLHTNAVASSQHASYAPCSVEELRSKGYDYWALGHVHEYKVLNEHPHVIYSGNTQGRSVRETGVKGCVLVTLQEGSGGLEIASCVPRQTDLARWYHETIELAEEDNEEALFDAVRNRLRSVITAADGRLAAVRLEFTGRCAVHSSLASDLSKQQLITNLRALASDFGDEIWIEKIKFRTQSPLDHNRLRERQDLLGQLLRDIDLLAESPKSLIDLPETKDIASKVAAELVGESGSEDDAGLFEDTERHLSWLRDAETLLLSQLVQESGDRS